MVKGDLERCLGVPARSTDACLPTLVGVEVGEYVPGDVEVGEFVLAGSGGGEHGRGRF